MADTVAVPAPAEAPAGEKKAKGKKPLVLLVIAVLAIAVGGVGARMFLLGPPTEAEAAPVAPEEGEIATIGRMTTSLAGSGTHYARVDLAAVLSAEATTSAVEERFPLMRDRALSVLMGFTARELRTVDGADALRVELTAAAQEVWEEEQVLRIVLTDLLVQ